MWVEDTTAADPVIIISEEEEKEETEQVRTPVVVKSRPQRRRKRTPKKKDKGKERVVEPELDPLLNLSSVGGHEMSGLASSASTLSLGEPVFEAEGGSSSSSTSTTPVKATASMNWESTASSSSSTSATTKKASAAIAATAAPNDIGALKGLMHFPSGPRKPPRVEPTVSNMAGSGSCVAAKVVKRATLSFTLAQADGQETEHKVDLPPAGEVYRWLQEEEALERRALNHMTTSYLRHWVLSQTECPWKARTKTNNPLIENLCQLAKTRESKRRKKRDERNVRETGLNIPLDERFTQYFMNVIYNEMQ